MECKNIKDIGIKEIKENEINNHEYLQKIDNNKQITLKKIIYSMNKTY